MSLDLIKTLCEYDKDTLKKELIKILKYKDYSPYITENFIVAEGDIPVALVAHMDTVFFHSVRPKDFLYDSKKKVLWTPHGTGFDDRAGIAIILDIIMQTDLRPHIIFTDGEESGGIGANDLIKKFQSCPFECYYLVQLDRANKKDAVFYNCNNKEFEDYIDSYGFETDIGTFTDISIIAPTWEIAAVNLSVGYLDEHTSSERLCYSWWKNTKDKLTSMLIGIETGEVTTKFKYIPRKPIKISGGQYIQSIGQCLICNSFIFNNNSNHNISICENCYNKYYK
jgi:hypothetical protein